jgi:predicted cupin superfamily sugar epimerase
VRSDELWLWHGPGTLLLHVGGAGDEPGAESAAMVGGDLAAGQQPQVLVPGGVWQRALPAGAAPVLVSCVVAPGFDFADFRVH